MLRLLHVSDIHFSNLLEGQPDLDLELAVRHRMLQDIGLMRQELGPMDGILAVGDIANRGQAEEFAKATDFLRNAAELIGCPPDKVVCVPGNHDVDRGVQDLTHDALRHQLRTIPPRELSDKLLALLRDPQASGPLFRPFAAYNEFALAYGCDISPQKPVYAPKVFELGSRRLQVHGITSSWVSDGHDAHDSDAQRLVGGLFQLASIGQDPETVSVTLCHHPPRWLRDAEELKPWTVKAHLVLTGHEHEAGVQQSEDGRTLFIASGAVNPSRTEAGWIPAYNIIEIEWNDSQPEAIEVAVYARSWQMGRAEFGPDDLSNEPARFQLSLTHPPKGADPNQSMTTRTLTQETVVSIPAAEPIESAAHTHAHTIMRAAPDWRRSEARAMGLLIDDRLVGLDADRALLNEALRTRRLSELAARLVGGSRHG